MSALITFLDDLGRSARHAAPTDAELHAATAAAALDDHAASALLARDDAALADLTGARLAMMCLLFPADEEPAKDDEPADDEPADDEKSQVGSAGAF